MVLGGYKIFTAFLMQVLDGDANKTNNKIPIAGIIEG